MYKEYKEKNQKNEEELLISKVQDKIQFAKSKNKITYTDFLNIVEKSKVEKFLKMQVYKNYFFFGGNDNSERGIYIFYPEKINEEMARKNLDDIFSIIKIQNSKEENYEHRIYLSALMKLGIKREKIGDIVVRDDGADIVIFKENAVYIENGLKQLTRFRNSEINTFELDKLENKPVEFEEFSIIVSALRLDCLVSELAKCSRNNAEEYIELGKVFINGIQEMKTSKKINFGDIITIRGKGKFIFDETIKETSKNRLVLKIRKYK